MGDYFYLDDPESDMGMTPVSSEEMVAAIRKVARREGVEISDEQIINEVFDKKQKNKTHSKRIKTFLYIDGTNLFVGLVQLFGLKRLPTFSSILNNINKLFKIDRIYFYASYTIPSNKKYKSSINAEVKFYRQVKSIPNLNFYKGHRSPTSGKEKGVDVHLAVDIIKHCLQNEYEKIVIMSGDADLSYPLEVARNLGKETHAVFLPNRFSLGISHRASSSFILNYRNHFRAIRKDLPRTLRVVKIKDPARKRTG